MNITVKVDEVSLATVVDQVTTYNEDGVYPNSEDRTVGHLVAEMIVDRLAQDGDRWYELRQTVTDIKREVIREAVRPMVEKAIAEPIQKTGAFGDPIGEPTSLREVIVDEARKLLSKPVDQYSRSGQTMLSKIVADEVQQAFAAEVRDAVKQARDQVSDEIGNQVAAAVKAGLKSR